MATIGPNRIQVPWVKAIAVSHLHIQKHARTLQSYWRAFLALLLVEPLLVGSLLVGSLLVGALPPASCHGQDQPGSDETEGAQTASAQTDKGRAGSAQVNEGRVDKERLDPPQPTQLIALSKRVRFELLDASPPQIHLSGLEDALLGQPAELFRVIVHASELNQPPAILGKFDRVEDSVVFKPRFPLSRSVAYEIQLLPALRAQFDRKERLVLQFSQDKSAPTAIVTSVFPSDSVLPENLLKFYIHFSEPMNRGEAYQRIQLFEGDQLVEQPFLELGEELWDAEQKRFTLFIHPGRIKRGLKPRTESGPSIAAGKEYSLKIDPAWTVAGGKTLKVAFEKKFRVVTADHEQPNPELWKIETPRMDTRNPVGLVFNEPLDHAMLNRVLVVRHQSGRIIEGEVSIVNGETKWLFTPDVAWPIGTYNISVAANLEDRSGNSIARPFEVKMQKREAASPKTQIAIEFIVK